MQSSNPKNAHLLNLSNSINVTHSSLITEKTRIPPKTKNVLFEKLNIETFKLEPCKITQSHNHKQCVFYHNNQDRKRSGNFYSEELCEYRKANQICPKGESCEKSHNQVEQLYREEKFKKKFCLHYPKNLDKCEYGRYCSFAHDENESLTELIHNYIYDYDFYIFHYKTVSCPFNLNHHVKSLCVYAHNWQDFRRKPNVHNYDPTPCSYWNPNDHILNYEKGCPHMFDCDKCHGWKEAEYHPMNYKTKKCPNEKNCRRNQDCPHYHNLEEQRSIGSLIQCQFFKLIPRNRVIENTFKINSPTKIYDTSFIYDLENVMSKHNSSIHSIETKGKECTPSSQGVLKKQSLNENEIDTLPIINEIERMRGYSLKNKKNPQEEILEKKPKRYSCIDSTYLKKCEIVVLEKKSDDEEEKKVEEKENHTITDSFIRYSQEMKNSTIPIINRASQDKGIALSGIVEYVEENDHFIINQILE